MLRRLAVAALAACAVPLAAMAQVGPPQDRYIVVLKAGPDLPEGVAADVAIRTGGRIGYIYEHALQGFTITMPRAAAAGVARDPRVAFIEEDRPVSIFAQTVPTGVRRIFADTVSDININGVDDKRVNVDIAILDTGIDFQHPDLNVVGGTNCLSYTGRRWWEREYYCGTDPTAADDDHYHGTHVAGTAAAIDNGNGVVGVAPGARLHAVKVLDQQGSGSFGGIIAGIDWVVAQGDIEVINMSLGGSGTSTAMNDAITEAVASGVTVVVAAGNSDADAANYTPANSPDAIAVSALADSDGAPGGTWEATCRTDQEDTLADFSNWGATVDIAAPGVCILSTYPLERGGYGTISGTSMASPHVAGAAALLASGNNRPVDRDGVMSLKATLLGAGNLNWSDDSGDGVKERLLDVSAFTAATVAGDGDTGTDNPPYNVSVTSPNNGATVSGAAFTVTANASDDNGVDRIEFFVNSTSIGTDGSSAGGWSVSWDTTAFPNGSGYTLTAKATDTIGQTTTSAGVSVTVNNSSGGGGISLTATGGKIKGVKYADLSWNPTVTGTFVNVLRNGAPLGAATANDGDYRDNTDEKGGGSYTYHVCRTDTGACSNEATVVW